MQGHSEAVGDKAVGFTHSTQTGSPSAPVGTASQSFSATVFLLPRSPCTSAMPGKRAFPHAPLKPRLPRLVPGDPPSVSWGNCPSHILDYLKITKMSS